LTHKIQHVEPLAGLPAAVADLAHTIQTAVAPVFLLTAMGSILNMRAGRVARIVDRERKIEAAFISSDHARHAQQVTELRLLDRRMQVVNKAIFLCTASATAMCITVAGLFVSSLAGRGFTGQWR
jgi:hypothetical protein